MTLLSLDLSSWESSFWCTVIGVTLVWLTWSSISSTRMWWVTHIYIIPHAALSSESVWSWLVPLLFSSHVDVREPFVLVPVFLWIFRQHNDQLMGFNLLQPALHLRPSNHIRRAGQRCVRRDAPRPAWSLQVWTKLAGGHPASHSVPLCCFSVCCTWLWT